MPWETARTKTVLIGVLGAAVFAAQLLTLWAIVQTKVEALREQKDKLEGLTSASSTFAPDYLFVDACCEHQGLEWARH